MTVKPSSARTQAVDWRLCPQCGQGQQPRTRCHVCDGRGEVPACTTVQDSCHGDPDIDACVCKKVER